jgi:UDP-N-acetylglucosamine--N-acetylmuramyl-(pentapeptide) pyrophosphoryl-undecaprenol N-acetylglucosamine transferase
MRFLFTGGGTGGHIYPAIAVIRALKEMVPEAEFLFVGTSQGLEASILPRAGIAFHPIRARGLRGKSPAVAARGLWEASQGFREARRLLKWFKPCVVVGTGGYVSGPVALASCLARVPTLLQEQNVVPGVTNRILGPLASGVAVPYEECRRYFGPRTRVMVTGNPVRPEILATTRDEGLRSLGLEPSLKTLLVLGGSRGAQALLDAALEALPRLPGRRWQALVITGEAYHQRARVLMDQLGIKGWWAGHIRLMTYLYEMEKAWASADLVMARAGAMTIAEVTALGRPSILVPSPNVAGDHQTVNARLLERKGAAVVIQEKVLGAEYLASALTSLMWGERRLEALGQSAKAMGRPRAAHDIAQEVLRLSRR